MNRHLRPSAPFNRPAWLVVLATVALAACGGGGGGGDGGGSSSGGGASGGGASAASFSQAPALPAAPTPLPVQNAFNVCEDVRFGGRDIENLQVPDGAVCVLDPGVEIDGNLELGNGAELYARGIRVGGNVQGQRAGLVVIEASTIGGNVQLDIGDEIALRVDGSIQLVANGGPIELDGNGVGGDIQLFENEGGATLLDNTADGNLQCKENQPAPAGSGNRAASKEDQCESL